MVSLSSRWLILLLHTFNHPLGFSTRDMSTPKKPIGRRVSTGIAGLDDVLGGGLPGSRAYLLQGRPGTGKTTLALEYLLEGVRAGEPGLYVTLSETMDEVLQVADSHGWSLDGVHVFDLTSSPESAGAGAPYTFFHPAEVELEEVVKRVFGEAERVKPLRVVIDSLTELRLLSRDPLRYRRQVLAFKQFFSDRHATLLLLTEQPATDADAQVESIVHGVIALDASLPDYGKPRRRLRVAKLRGSKHREGYHDFTIETGGIAIYPRLVAAEHQEKFVPRAFPSGVAALDELIGGGLDAGTATLILGPAGAGKSTLAAQYAVAAARAGKGAALYNFDETRATLLARTSALGIDLAGQLKAGKVAIRQLDPAEISPGEFAWMIRRAVEQEGAALVVIDSINGYYQAMPEERFLAAHLHELLSYLNRQGVATILVMEQFGMLGRMASPVDVSYLTDAVLLLRYFEAEGEIRQAISAIKRRSGDHERAIREFRIGAEGIEVGHPLKEFRGVLTGHPEYFGGGTSLDSNDTAES